MKSDDMPPIGRSAFGGKSDLPPKGRSPFHLTSRGQRKSDSLHRTVLMRYGCISFLIGVGCASTVLDASWIPRPSELFFLFLAISGFFLVIRARWAGFIAVAIFGFLWMDGYHELRKPIPPPAEPISVTGVVRFADPMFNKQRLVVELPSEHLGRTALAYVYIERYPLRKVGTRVAFTCLFEVPKPFDTFAFDIYAARNGIDYVCRYPYLKEVDFEQGIRSVLFTVKEWYSQHFSWAFHQPENGLAQAMVLARVGELSQTLRIEFSRAGIVHVISISGLHMALLTMLLELMLQAVGFGRTFRFGILAIFSFFYLVILGFPPPAVRSVIMVLLLLFARIVGRPSQGMHLLLMAATIMVMQNPYALGFDIGFQLSFAALGGIMATNEWWERVLRFMPERFAFRSVTAMTCSAQLFTWPLTAYYFGMFSLVAPVANIAVAALLGPVLVGALLIPFAMSVPFAAPFIVWPTFFMLKALIIVAHYASAVPFAVIPLPAYSLPFTIVSFSVVGILYRLFIRKEKMSLHNSPPSLL